MKMGITGREATSLMLEILNSQAGAIIYTSDQTYLMQVLYKARRDDPDLADLHITRRPEGLLVWHARDTQVQEYCNSRGIKW